MIARPILISFCLSGILWAGLAPAAVLDPADYLFREKVAFTNAPAGDTLTNFPLLVRFDAARTDFFGYLASRSGGDVRFTDGTGTNLLVHESEILTSNASFWVQVPAFSNNSCLYAYWGNAVSNTAPAYSTNGATWNGAYEIVWHLNQRAGLAIPDSTSNQRTGTMRNTEDGDWTPGLVGGGVTFDGVNEYGVLALNQVDNEVSHSMWVRTSVGGRGIFALTFPELGGASDRHIYLNGGDVNSRIWNNEVIGTAGLGLTDGRWHQIVRVFGSSIGGQRIYVDGVLRATGVKATSDFNWNSHMQIGFSNDGAIDFFDGMMDEVRVSYEVRGSNWIWASWFNVASNQTFNRHGGSEVLDPTLPLVAALPPSFVTTNSAVLNGLLSSTGMSATVVHLVYGTNDGGAIKANWDTEVVLSSAGTPPQNLFTNITGLVSGNRYFYRLYATNSAAEFWSMSTENFVAPGPPFFDNEPGATGPGVGFATLNGRFLSENRGDVSFFWGPTDEQTNAGAWVFSAILGLRTNAMVSHTATGLLYGVDYHYRVFGSNAYGVGWAAASTNFKTLRPPGIDLNNRTASNISLSNATLNAVLEGPGSRFDVTAYWGPTDGGTNSGAWSNRLFVGRFDDAPLAPINQFVLGLVSNSFTYFTFRMTNCLEDTWAQPSERFRTLGAQPMVDNAGGAADLNVSRVRLQGSLTAGGAADVTIYYGTTDSGNLKGSWEGAMPLGETLEGSFSGQSGDLLYGLTYFYRAYASNEVGEAWATNAVPFKPTAPTMAPDTLTGLELWLNASTIASNHNDLVGVWPDDSGNGYDVENLTGASDPRLNTNGLNGLPVVRYDGNDHQFTTHNFQTIGAHTIFTVARYTNPAGGLASRRVISAQDNNWLFGFWNGGDERWYSGAFIHNTGNANTNWHLHAGTMTADPDPLATFWKDGTQLTVNNPASIPPHAPTRFSLGGGQNGAEPSQADVAEVILFNRVLTEKERTGVAGYLERKYNLGTSYPAEIVGIHNEAAALVTQTSAVLRATLCATQSVFDVTLFYGPTDGMTDPLAWSNEVPVGTFTNLEQVLSYPLAGLTEGQTYYYSFRATNCAQVAWGDASTAFVTSLNPSLFSFSSKIRFCGYAGGGILTNFPTLVELGTNIPGFDYGQLLAGVDLRFFDATQTLELPFEIDTWNTNGQSLVWVRVPELVDSNTCIYALWGSPAFTNLPAYSDEVWNPNYIMVHHLSETSGVHRDSTALGNDAPPLAGVDQSEPGVVGSADFFDGVDDAVDLSAVVNDFNATRGTISLWARYEDFNNQTWPMLFGMRNAGDLFELYEGAGLLYFRYGNAGAAVTTPVPGLSEWNHWSFRWDATSGADIFRNGIQVASQALVWPPMDIGGPFYLGDGDGPTFNLEGALDETRFSAKPLSSNWIHTAWVNMASNRNFACYEMAVSAGAVDLALTKVASSANLLLGTNLTYTIGLLNSSTVTVGGVTVTDTLPASVTFLSSTPPADLTNGNDFVYQFGNFLGGAMTSILIQVSVTFPLETIITNIASVATTNMELFLGNNRALAVTVIPDSDADGIANPADPDDDNDGFADTAEVIAGTDYLDGSSFLWLWIDRSPDQLVRTLYFPTVSNRTYRLQSSTNFMAGPWINVRTNIPGDGAVNSVVSTNLLNQWYYRLGVESP